MTPRSCDGEGSRTVAGRPQVAAGDAQVVCRLLESQRRRAARARLPEPQLPAQTAGDEQAGRTAERQTRHRLLVTVQGAAGAGTGHQVRSPHTQSDAS